MFVKSTVAVALFASFVTCASEEWARSVAAFSASAFGVVVCAVVCAAVARCADKKESAFKALDRLHKKMLKKPKHVADQYRDYIKKELGITSERQAWLYRRCREAVTRLQLCARLYQDR